MRRRQSDDSFEDEHGANTKRQRCSASPHSIVPALPPSGLAPLPPSLPSAEPPSTPPCFTMLVTGTCPTSNCLSVHLRYGAALNTYLSREPTSCLPEEHGGLTPYFTPSLVEEAELSPYHTTTQRTVRMPAHRSTAVLPLPITCKLLRVYQSPDFIPDLRSASGLSRTDVRLLLAVDDAQVASSECLYGFVILSGCHEHVQRGIEAVIRAVEAAAYQSSPHSISTVGQVVNSSVAGVPEPSPHSFVAAAPAPPLHSSSPVAVELSFVAESAVSSPPPCCWLLRRQRYCQRHRCPLPAASHDPYSQLLVRSIATSSRTLSAIPFHTSQFEFVVCRSPQTDSCTFLCSLCVLNEDSTRGYLIGQGGSMLHAIEVAAGAGLAFSRHTVSNTRQVVTQPWMTVSAVGELEAVDAVVEAVTFLMEEKLELTHQQLREHLQQWKQQRAAHAYRPMLWSLTSRGAHSTQLDTLLNGSIPTVSQVAPSITDRRDQKTVHVEEAETYSVIGQQPTLSQPPTAVPPPISPHAMAATGKRHITNMLTTAAAQQPSAFTTTVARVSLPMVASPSQPLHLSPPAALFSSCFLKPALSPPPPCSWLLGRSQYCQRARCHLPAASHDLYCEQLIRHIDTSTRLLLDLPSFTSHFSFVLCPLPDSDSRTYLCSLCVPNEGRTRGHIVGRSEDMRKQIEETAGATVRCAEADTQQRASLWMTISAVGDIESVDAVVEAITFLLEAEADHYYTAEQLEEYMQQWKQQRAAKADRPMLWSLSSRGMHSAQLDALLDDSSLQPPASSTDGRDQHQPAAWSTSQVRSTIQPRSASRSMCRERELERKGHRERQRQDEHKQYSYPLHTAASLSHSCSGHSHHRHDHSEHDEEPRRSNRRRSRSRSRSSSSNRGTEPNGSWIKHQPRHAPSERAEVPGNPCPNYLSPWSCSDSRCRLSHASKSYRNWLADRLCCTSDTFSMLRAVERTFVGILSNNGGSSAQPLLISLPVPCIVFMQRGLLRPDGPLMAALQQRTSLYINTPRDALNGDLTSWGMLRTRGNTREVDTLTEWLCWLMDDWKAAGCNAGKGGLDKQGRRLAQYLDKWSKRRAEYVAQQGEVLYAFVSRGFEARVRLSFTLPTEEPTPANTKLTAMESFESPIVSLHFSPRSASSSISSTSSISSVISLSPPAHGLNSAHKSLPTSSLPSSPQASLDCSSYAQRLLLSMHAAGTGLAYTLLHPAPRLLHYLPASHPHAAQLRVRHLANRSSAT